jgi:hypothetical protein
VSRFGVGMARARAVPMAIVVLTAGLLLVVVSAWAGVRSVQALTSADALKRAKHENVQFACLESRLHQLVPRGSAVAVAVVVNPSWHTQRLTEWSTDWARVVSDPTKAQYVLEVVRGPRSRCFGLDVSATAP